MYVIYVYHVNTQGPRRSEKGVEFLVTGVTVVSCYVGSGNQTKVLRKSNKYFELLRDLNPK